MLPGGERKKVRLVDSGRRTFKEALSKPLSSQ
jgi:hypothetical protein